MKKLVTEPMNSKDISFKMERFMFLALGIFEKIEERINQIEGENGVS